jgi:DNA-binding NarL/FixJ family response regulator
LVNAIRAVVRGQSLLDPKVTRPILDGLRKVFTEQENRVVELVAAGRSNREIGAELHLTERTVKNYLSSVYAKLGLARRSEAAAYLASRGSPPAQPSYH